MKHVGIFAAVLLVCLIGGYVWFQSEVQAPEVTDIDVTELPPVPDVKNDEGKITLEWPHATDTVTSPLQVTGTALGPWFFEAAFPVTILGIDGTLLAQGMAVADGEWMTTEPVAFTADLEYTLPEGATSMPARLVFYKANPSGLEELADTVEVPIVLE